MKVTRIAAVIAVATAMTGAFAATPDADAVNQQPTGAATVHKWYEAGDRVLQSEQDKAKLERQGFSVY